MNTLAHQAWLWSRQQGDALAFRQIDRQMAVVDHSTWRGLAAAAAALSARLQDAGVLPGEPVLVAARDPLEYVRAVFACWWAGAIAVPLPHGGGRRASELLALAGRICGARFGLREAGVRASGDSSLRWLPTAAAATALELAPPLCSPDGTALIQLSSGSTATPKAVQLLHRHLSANQHQIATAFGHDASARIVGWLPLNHDMGLIGNVLQNVHLGAQCTLLPARDFSADPLSWIRAVSAFEATTSGGPDSAYAIAASLAEAGGLNGSVVSLAAWRVAFNGAEPILGGTLRRFAAAFARFGFDARAQLNCYGLAEASLIVTAGPARDAAGRLPPDELIDSGRPSGAGQVRIVDPVTHRQLDDGQEGEVWVAGPSVAESYWGNAEATSRLLHAATADEPAQACFLRTGDLGLLHQGRLVVRGRLDDRMSLRGRNIDAGDVERCVAQAVPGLTEHRVAAFQYAGASGSGAGLGVIIEGPVDLTPGEARDRAAAAVSEAFGLLLQAVGFARAGELPRTTSGKRRRRECARRFNAGGFSRPPIDVGDDAPLSVLCNVLGRTVRREDLAGDWRSLGGDSLSAARCVAQWRSIGVVVPVDVLLGATAVAEVLASAARRDVSPGKQLGEPTLAAESLAARLLRQSALDGGAGASHVEWAAWLEEGPLGLCDELEARWRRMHEVFQALRLVAPGRDATLPLLAPGLSPDITREDARGWSDARVLADMRVRRATPFEPGTPLFRFTLYSRGVDQAAAVLVVAHHAVCDLASLRRLATVLFDADLPLTDDNEAFARLVGLEPTWSVAGVSPATPPIPLTLPTDRPAPAQPDYRGAEQRHALSVLHLRALARAASTADCSLPSFVASLWAVTLARLGDTPSAEVDLAVDLRPLHDLDGAVGCGIGMVTLAAELTADVRLSELSRQLDGQLHARLAGRVAGRAADKAVSAVGPAAELRAAFQWVTPAEAELLGHASTGWTAELPGAVRVRPLRLPVDAVQWSLKLTVSALADGSGEAHLAYAAARFDAATARAVLDAFMAAVQSLCGPELDPRASDLPLMDQAARARLNAWSTGPGSGRAPQPLSALLAALGTCPDAVALVDRAPLDFQGEALPEMLTQAGLLTRVHGLAARLTAAGIGAGDVVGLALPRSSLFIVAALAVLRAGAAFAPFNPQDSPERRAAMLADLGATLVLAAAPVDVPSEVRVMDLRLPFGAVETVPLSPLPRVDGGDPASLAYAMFTSGSTGRPKAVLVEHGAIGARLASMRHELGLTSADTVLHKTAPTFDVSVWEMLLPLVCGARLVVAGPGVERDAQALEALMLREGISIVHFVPSMLGAFLAGRPRAIGGGVLRRVICSGEALSVPLRNQALRAFGADVELWNYYGPTEAAIDVCIHRASAADPCSPIGRPVADTRLLVIDRWGGLAPVGGSGELHIGGQQLAHGYAGRPDLTDAAFRHRCGERLYATGDRARWLPQGVLEHLGRHDDQWKIRGQRIERSEIEAAMRSVPGIADAAVALRRGSHGDAHLEAYVVPVAGPPPEIEDLRASLARRLPAVMQPARLAVLVALPLNASGKVDRQALPALLPAASADSAAWLESSDPVEALIRDAFTRALELSGCGPDDNFFALGGDSLRAIRVVAQAQERGLTLSVAQIYAAPTPRALAREMVGHAQDGRLTAGAKGGLPDGGGPTMRVGEPFPLSSAQQSLLFLSEADPGYEIYVTSLRLSGPAEADLLNRAVQAVVNRHPFLRLACDPLALPEPLQHLCDQAPIHVDVRDARHQSLQQQAQTLEQFIAQERLRPFDWRQAPLLRVTVHRWANDCFQLTLSDPSMDGWCVATTLTEIVQRYGALLTGAPTDDTAAPEHFRAFVELERQSLADPVTRAYWASVLGQRESELPMRPEPVTQARRPRRRVLRFAAAMRWRLESTARLIEAGLRHVLLAAHAHALWRLRGEVGGWVCAEVTGRPEAAGGDADLGVYNNIVPVPMDVVGHRWRDLATAASVAEQALLPHRRFPYAALRTMAGGELADAVFVHTHFRPYRTLSEGPVRLLDLNATDQTYVPLTAHFTLDPLGHDLLVLIDHDEAVYGPAAVEGYEAALREALLALALRPDDAFTASPALAPPGSPQPAWSLVDAFVAQARRVPDAVALEQAGRQLSYGALLRRAGAVAAALVARGLGPESRVALDVPLGPDLLTGMLGCLFAGAAFVPLDTASPGERLAAILAVARPALVLQGQARADAGDDRVPRLSLSEALAHDPIPPRVLGMDALAYVLFTSGSTGRPKGVAVGRHQLGAYLAWAARTYAFTAGRGAGLVTGGDVDMSVTPLFGPLVTGRRLVFATEVGDVGSLRRMAADPDLGVLKLTPSHLDALAAAQALPRPGQWPAELILGGEDIAPRHLALLHAARCEIINEYGPTETTVGCLAARLPPSPRSPADVTLGQPTDGAVPRLVDPFGAAPQDGLPGEIVVGGAQVARGYLDDPARTAAVFRPAAGGLREYHTGDRALRGLDGALRYQGRIDRQAKVNGRRLELGEVEDCLLRLPGVAHASCLTLSAGDGRTVLGACVVPSAGARLDSASLRTGLARLLPPPLVPARIALIDALPLNAAGKLDRGRLRQALEAPTEPDWLTAMLDQIGGMSDDDVAAALARRGTNQEVTG